MKWYFIVLIVIGLCGWYISGLIGTWKMLCDDFGYAVRGDVIACFLGGLIGPTVWIMRADGRRAKKKNPWLNTVVWRKNDTQSTHSK